jgi:MYXO-CTERM domain-containing protein
MRTTIKLGVAALALWAAPQDAHACGGFFCNNQAIDQSGERILYSYNEDGTVTSVIQMMYSGPSEEFAWILPIPAEPTVSIGTDELFRQLELSTAPSFGMTSTTQGQCRSVPECRSYWDDDLSGEDPNAGRADASFAADAGVAGPTVDVTFRGNVGPYDAAVLRSGDGDALRAWLTDNGYAISPAAGLELDYYVETGHYFVALKLQQNRGSGEIQPVVITSDNTLPCIPLRLTSIASVPDMPVTAYFLTDRRVRPSNYLLVNADLDQSGLYMGSLRYTTVVGRTVDDAGGRAFVTDYAGDVPTLNIEVSPVEEMRTITNASDFVRELQGRGFAGDSQLLALLMRFVPPPESYDPQTFYNCIVGFWCDSSTQAYLDALAFDPNAFVDALNEAIIDPRREAQEMLERHSHLTRLFTTMSSEEMTEDPLFERSDELPREFSNRHTAVLRTDCGPDYFHWTAPQSLVFPSGREEQVREGVPYLGSDSQYCEDYYGGDFHPGTPMDRLREIARTRRAQPGGGGLCSAGPGQSPAWLALVIAAVVFAAQRRRL